MKSKKTPSFFLDQFISDAHTCVLPLLCGAAHEHDVPHVATARLPWGDCVHWGDDAARPPKGGLLYVYESLQLCDPGVKAQEKQGESITN